MDERIGRLLAAGNRLKSLIENSRSGLGEELSGVVTHWNQAVELVLDHSAAVTARSAAAPGAESPEARDFDYLAFDTNSQALLGFGSMAVFALQNADEAHPDSSIEILYAGPFGRRIWEKRLGLGEVAPILKAHFGAP